MKQKCAFFDFDYTIAHGDSINKLLLYTLKKYPLSVFRFLPLIPYGIGYVLHICSMESMKSWIHFPLDLLTEEEIKDSLKLITRNYDRVLKQLDELTEAFKLNSLKFDDPVITNSQFTKLMGISLKTAQSWRDQNIVNYSQVGNKIYYRASDIKVLLDSNYRKTPISE